MTTTSTQSDAAVAILGSELSKATQHAIEPVRLNATDHLCVSLTDDGKWFSCFLDSVRDGKRTDIHYAPSNGAERFLRNMPEARWAAAKLNAYHSASNKDRWTWRVPATDYAAVLIKMCWPAERMSFATQHGAPTDEHAKAQFELLLERLRAQGEAARMCAEFKLSGKAPQKPAWWLERDDVKLSPYQVVGTMAAMRSTGFALFTDRGTGKTPMAIQAVAMGGVRKRRLEGKMFRALVVCSPQVRMQWKEEVEKFAPTQGKVVVARGTQIDRIRALHQGIASEDDCAFSIVVIGYDSLAGSIELYSKVKWDLIVADESHNFKSSYTKRWKMMLQLRESAAARLIMTGTPIGNSIMDLWTQLEFLGEGLSGFNHYGTFRRFHGSYQQIESGPGKGVELLVAVKNVPLMQERLARLSFSVSKEEAGLNLPPKTYDALECEMQSTQAKIYDQLAEQLAAEIEDDLSGETNSLTVDHILTKLLRLAQVTSGFVSYDPSVEGGARRVVQIPGGNPKLDLLIQELTDEGRDPREKTIVWAHFVEDIKAIGQRLTEAGIKFVTYYGGTSESDRLAAVADFNNDPTVKVFVANPATAGEGLNLLGYDLKQPDRLDTYVSQEIFFSQNWSSIQRQQAEDRAHRRGTRMPLRITNLVVPGTIDEEIRHRVESKKQTALTILDIRDILRSIKGE